MLCNVRKVALSLYFCDLWNVVCIARLCKHEEAGKTKERKKMGNVDQPATRRRSVRLKGNNAIHSLLILCFLSPLLLYL